MVGITSELASDEQLSEKVAAGDPCALETLLSRHRGRLKRMVGLRLSSRLRRRVDDSDIVQESLIQAALNIGDYDHDPARPFYLWIRKITENKLIKARRRHLGASKRDANKEIDFNHRLPIDTQSLAQRFLLSSGSSPSVKAAKAEVRNLIQDGLAELSDVDREVLVLHHFEQLSFAEIGAMLEMSKSGAAKRYLVALNRLRSVLDQVPGLLNL